jgi:hypothetical protein
VLAACRLSGARPPSPRPSWREEIGRGEVQQRRERERGRHRGKIEREERRKERCILIKGQIDHFTPWGAL